MKLNKTQSMITKTTAENREVKYQFLCRYIEKFYGVPPSTQISDAESKNVKLSKKLTRLLLSEWPTASLYLCLRRPLPEVHIGQDTLVPGVCFFMNMKFKRSMTSETLTHKKKKRIFECVSLTCWNI